MNKTTLLAGVLAAGFALAIGSAVAQSGPAVPGGPAAMQGGAPCGPGTGMGMGRGRMGCGMGDGMGQGMGRGMGHGRGAGMGVGMMQGGAGYMLAFAEPGRLDALKVQIGIADGQRDAWARYAKVVADVATTRKANREGMDRDAVMRMSPQDRAAFRAGMRAERLKEAQAVGAAAGELVATLDPAQKAKARTLLPGYAFGIGPRAGMGGRW